MTLGRRILREGGILHTLINHHIYFLNLFKIFQIFKV